jgi:hypothetical protein
VNGFKEAVEARGVDVFWASRKKGKLHSRSEKIAQGLLGVFCRGVLMVRGNVLREYLSGVGFVDAAILISSTIHLVEIKMLTSTFTGSDQLEEYMRIENKKKGYLVVFDALPPGKKKVIPSTLRAASGLIYVIIVDINPLAPSALNLRKQRKIV